MAIGATGLRERKKRATRVALSDAAMRLTVQRGFDHVTIDDIAAEVEVSARTFSNYFPCKEAAVLASATDMTRRMTAEFERRPDGEALWSSLRAAVVSAMTHPDEPERSWVAQLQVISRTPALLAYQLSTMVSAEALIADEVARRTGTAADRDIYPRLVSATVSAIARSATAQWLAAGSTVRLDNVINDAFDHVAGGLPVPPSALSVGCQTSASPC
jgi:AcrR family transcriptional regulator